MIGASVAGGALFAGRPAVGGAGAGIADALPASVLVTRCPRELVGAAGVIGGEADHGSPDLPPFGQERAVAALETALAVAGPGYHVFVLAEPGLEPLEALRRLLQRHVATRPAPADWCYLFNFADANRPRLLSLAPGEGARLRAAMQRFVAELSKAVTAGLEGDEYRSRLQAIQDQAKSREEGSLRALGDEAVPQGVALLRTPQGFAFAPMKDERPMPPEDFDRLDRHERERLEAAIDALREKLQKLLNELPRQRREMQQHVREATRDTLARAVGHLIDEVQDLFPGRTPIHAWLDEVRRDVIEAGESLRRGVGSDGDEPGVLTGQLALQRYQVNLLVGHGSDDAEDLSAPRTDGPHAPVRTCEHPTYAHLIGRIDHVAHMGTLLTDFTLIRAGALHRANGGVLLLDAWKVLSEPLAWEGLKRALKAGHVVIESLPQALGWINTLPLEPEPVPLDLKIVLVGQRRLYYLLQALDPDFDDLFKVAADFEDDIERSPTSSAALARHLASLAQRHRLRTPDDDALARLVDHAARLADDAARLSTHSRPLLSLMREADTLAAAAGRTAMGRGDIVQALQARVRRADRLRDRIHDALRRDTLLVDTAGAQIGQVNGLAVADLGDFRFGHPVRITATTRLGDGHFVDIERESALGGALHTKGVMILSSFLASRYAKGLPLSLAASLVFEQSYGPVEGDSASLAELCALLSALAEAPLRQDLAMTGSVNQHGRVQAVGGVNEKIEGFFDLCRERGLSGAQGVLIPRTNVQHLMLRDDVVDAAEAGRFHVWAVDDVDQALALVTGLPASAPDSRGLQRPDNLNRRISDRLAALSRLRQRWGAGPPRSASGRAHRAPGHQA